MYLGVRFIDLPASAPIAGADGAYDVSAIGKPDRHDTGTDPAETVEAIFGAAVRGITSKVTIRVQEGQLCPLKAKPIIG